uniref:Zinc finger, CCHC-type n=1 Tax=Tanacetum cinerariifolium TaxID=118510 RepID=A0A699IBF0_TANCI|nr:zinc finger, CCHC-type [Tanacetum cinerariifolium]GEZ36942.1 zinc finger, CCHC-type [Tanacetum cinerariifolium]
MADAAMKHMASNFVKLDKFEGMNFRGWQKKMHFLLSSMSVVYVLTTFNSEDGENAIVEQLRMRSKWDNDDYVCRGLILNVMEQYNELLGILGRFTQHKMNMDDVIQVSCIIDKLPPSWKDFKHTLKHQKEELTLVELGSHLHIDKSLKVQDNDKPKGNNVGGPLVVNMMEHNNSFRYNDNKGKRKHQDTKVDPNKKSKVTCWKYGKLGHLKKDCKGGKVGNKATGLGTNGSVDGFINSLKGGGLTQKKLCMRVKIDDGHVHYKRMQDMSKDGLIPAFDMNTEKCKTCMMTKITKKPFQNVKCETKVLELIHSDLCDLHATPSPRNKKYFVTNIDDASKFCYVYLLHTKNEELDKFKVFKTKVELQQESQIKRFRTDRGGTRDEVFDQHYYCFNVQDDPKTFDEVMKSRDVAF